MPHAWELIVALHGGKRSIDPKDSSPLIPTYWGTQPNRVTIWAWVKDAVNKAVKAGTLAKSTASTHFFRHGYATLGLVSGASLMTVSHASTETTAALAAPPPYGAQRARAGLMLRAGPLPHMVAQHSTSTVDAEGQSQNVWATLITVAARVAPLTGQEFIDAAQFAQQVTHRVTMRWPGFTVLVSDRLAFNAAPSTSWARSTSRRVWGKRLAVTPQSRLLRIAQ